MRKLSKNKLLNDTLHFQQMLLWEVTGGALGQENKSASTVPFVEKLKLLNTMQDSVLLTHKVEPKKQTSGLESLRDMMRDSEDETPSEMPFAVDKGDEVNGSRETKGGGKRANCSATAPIFEDAAKSASHTGDDEISNIR